MALVMIVMLVPAQALSVSAETTGYILGDVDQDGKISAMDSAKIKLYKLGSLTLDRTSLLSADVDQDGSVTAMDSAKIKLFKLGQLSGFTKTTVRLNASSLSFTQGDRSQKLTASLSSNSAPAKLGYTSSNPSVASVDQNGNVTPKAAGSTVITAKIFNDETASCTVTVNAKPVPPVPSQFYGIDVSHHQKKIDWQRVKDSGVDFAMIRSGYGKDYFDKEIQIDKQFYYNMEQAKKVGMKVGAYHFSYAKSVEQAKQEADLFLKIIQGYDFEYPVVFDIEHKSQLNLSRKLLTDITIAFCDKVQKAGYHVLVYSYDNFFQTKLDMTRLTQYEKWVANFSKPPTLNAPYTMWQYTKTGSNAGISGYVDKNISYLDYDSIIKRKGLNKAKGTRKLRGTVALFGEDNGGVTTLRVRQQPSENSAILRNLGRGKTFDILEVQKDWLRVRLTDGTLGYISCNYGNVLIEDATSF